MKKCYLCGTTQKLTTHHLFSQGKLNRSLYGELIDHPKNKVWLCIDCHLTAPIPKLTEKEFCERLGIAPRSKMLTRGF